MVGGPSSPIYYPLSIYCCIIIAAAAMLPFLIMKLSWIMMLSCFRCKASLYFSSSMARLFRNHFESPMISDSGGVSVAYPMSAPSLRASSYLLLTAMFCRCIFLIFSIS